MDNGIRGLTAEDVKHRRLKGQDNYEISPPTKTVKQIILSNTLTYFNLVFTVLAIGVIIAGSWKNLTFMGVIVANTLIGIIQELKSKRTLDKMALLTSRKCNVIRDGKIVEVDIHNTVLGDAVIFSAGSQIFADAVVIDGTAVANEALITGEADEIPKKIGDELISGSFIMSGKCIAELTAVGEDSFAAKLTIEAKKSKNRGKSEMMLSLTRLVKWIGVLLVPIGALLLVKEIVWLDGEWKNGIISTVAALIGMIPEGLYLLTSLALVASVIRLTKKKTLVHDMDCIETLARVDTLCVDKTGTVTENKMNVEDIVPLNESIDKTEIASIMADYVFAMQADNDTMIALKKYFTGKSRFSADRIFPFTSSKKYGGAVFDNGKAFVLGAPDVIMGERYSQISSVCDRYSDEGCRVLLLAGINGELNENGFSGKCVPISLILLANKIRENAPEVFGYFAENNVDIKVISGDNAKAVSSVARRAGILGAENYIDARELTTDDEITEATEKYTVFGRVVPEQKKKIIRALRNSKHTVAMTGDGVNDVLALKEADVSIAMASGSEIASQASHIVLLDSDFASMPAIVGEGRRVINNIERSASLYLTKNIFSFILAIITLFFTLPYPLEPSQLSLISALMIGIPSFILAMEPNNSLVRGHFLKNVLLRAFPAALTSLFSVLGVLLFYLAFDIPKAEMSTCCAYIVAVVGMIMLYVTCIPFDKIRVALIISMGVLFILAIILFPSFFSLAELSIQSILILSVFILLSVPVYQVISWAFYSAGKRIRPKKENG